MRNRIKKIRREADLTQQEFADRLGVKRGTIANYELGRNIPIDAVISLICREFEINEEWLRTGKGTKEQPEPKNELDKLAEKYNMSHDEYIFLEMYFKKKRSERDAIFRFLHDTFSAIETDSKTTSQNQETSAEKTNFNDMSIDEQVELYRKELEKEKKATEKSEVLRKNA